eukprot:3939387-Alexandrium_andersonii.AAC.1
MDGGEDCELHSKLEKAWKAFWRLRHILLAKHGTPSQRLCLMNIAVGGFSSGGANPGDPHLISFDS